MVAVRKVTRTSAVVILLEEPAVDAVRWPISGFPII